MISALILAAGRSSRMGRPKQLLELEGRPILDHVVDAAAAAHVDDVVIVLGHEAERIEDGLHLPPSARVAVNPEYEEGQSSSLRVGLDALDPSCTAAVILMGDQPTMPSSVIDDLIGAYRDGGRVVTRAVWKGTPGHPVVVPASAWEAFRQVVGDQGARGIIGSLPHVDVTIDRSQPDDIDDWDAYQELLRSYR